MQESIGQFTWAEGAETFLLGDPHPLLEQLGSPDGLADFHAGSEALLCPKIDSAETLGVFLQAYEDHILFPFELPAIFRAHWFASQGKARELIALDRELTREPIRPEFARASQRAGLNQLRRLKPMRDLRVAQRYLEAVEQNQAHGWHTIAYGLTLAVYSLPVRQGLMSYARQTLQALICAAGRSIQLSDKECLDILGVQCADLPRLLDRAMRTAKVESLFS